MKKYMQILLGKYYQNIIDKLNLKFVTNIIRYLDSKFPSAYHIFVIKLNLDEVTADRDRMFINQ